MANCYAKIGETIKTNQFIMKFFPDIGNLKKTATKTKKWFGKKNAAVAVKQKKMSKRI